MSVPAILSIVLPVVAPLLFLGLLLFIEIGFRSAARRPREETERARSSAGVLEGAVLGLLGLLLAFTFSWAAGRMDHRRELIIAEANAIGTAYLRLDLLPEAEQPELRRLFRRLLDVRIETFQDVRDLSAVRERLAEANRIQKEIWTRCRAASRASEWTPAAILLLPAVNAVIDLTAARTVSVQTHVPGSIVALLVTAALLGAFLLGRAMASGGVRNPSHMLVFAAIVALTIHVILDLEYPRIGLVRIGVADQALVLLRDSIK